MSDENNDRVFNHENLDGFELGHILAVVDKDSPIPYLRNHDESDGNLLDKSEESVVSESRKMPVGHSRLQMLQ